MVWKLAVINVKYAATSIVKCWKNVVIWLQNVAKKYAFLIANLWNGAAINSVNVFKTFVVFNVVKKLGNVLNICVLSYVNAVKNFVLALKKCVINVV